MPAERATSKQGRSSGAARVAQLAAAMADGRPVAPARVNATTDAYPQAPSSAWLCLQSAEPVASTGKYLFFDTDIGALAELALSELADHGFGFAKVSVVPSGTSEHCLCLYWADASRGPELQARHPDMKYRGFKTDAATRAGVISAQGAAARRNARARLRA